MNNRKRSAGSRRPVLREKPAHKQGFGQNSERYMFTVRKWRHAYYGLVHDILMEANQFNFPIDFSPIEQYFSNFSIEYHDIAELPSDFLAHLREEGEVEEGWNLVDKKAGIIHIFYDPNVSLQRQRFTIAHEWGHVIQKFDPPFKADMESIPDDAERNAIVESVANHFAAYYLVPHPILTHEIGCLGEMGVRTLYVELAQRFNVSEQMMQICLTNFRPKIKR